MSLKKYFLIFCCLGFAGLGAGGAIFYFSNSAGRNPASALPAPLVKKGNWMSADSGFVGKPLRTMNVTITAVHGVPSENRQEIVLRGDVTLLQNLGRDVEYKWILPDDVVVVEGNLEDVWQNLQEGQSASAEISLLNLSRETPKTVVFQAVSAVNGVKMIGSSAFTTAPHSAVAPEDMSTAQKMDAEDTKDKKSEAFKQIQQ